MNKNMNKSVLRFGGALAAGAVLLASGAAGYSLWSDQVDANGVNIVSGRLDIEATNTVARDISADRVDSPHEIDPATWRAVPGDTVEISHSMDVALEGDNLVAKVNTDAINSVVEAAGAADYVTWSVEVRDMDGNVITDGIVQASGDGQAAGVDENGIYIAGSTVDGVADVDVTVTVNFSADTPDQVLQEVTLADFANDDAVTLEQIREGTSNFGTSEADVVEEPAPVDDATTDVVTP